MMLKFGKKLNYRPLLISAAIGLMPGLAANDIFESPAAGFIGFAIFFLFIFLGYYLFNVSILFNYWEVDQDQIRYTNMNSYLHRIVMMFLPMTVNHLTKINLQDVASLTVQGTYDKPKGMPFALPFTPYMGILFPILSIAHNPLDVMIKLKNGQSVQLSMARDYIYNSAATFKKLDQLMEIAKENSIPVHNRMRNISDKSDKMTVETW